MTALLTVVLGTAVAVVPAAPAAAACFGSGCNGLDPNANGCSAVTTAQNGYWGSVPAYTAQLRYSNNCVSVWARGFKDCTPSGGDPLAHVRLQRRVWSSYGWYIVQTYFSPQLPCGGSGNPVWTPMVGNYGEDQHNACVAIHYSWDHPSTFPDSWWGKCTGFISIL